MSDTTLRTHHTPERGIVQIHSPITEQLALDFCDTLDVLYGYYQYENVLVRIQSQGGQLLALDYMIDCIDRWRDQGRTLHTQATMQANSAAALLLSLGDMGERSASPCSNLLYHQSRYISPSPQAITGASAMEAAKQLLASDRRLMQRLSEHLVQGCGSPQAVAAAGLQRIEQTRQLEAALPKEEHTSGWIDTTREAFVKVNHTGNMLAYQEHLRSRFDQDRAMELCEAWGLLLIDRVTGPSTASSTID